MTNWICISLMGVVMGVLIWLFWDVALARKRSVKILAQSSCPACGKPIGMENAKKVEREFVEEHERIRAANPGVRLRLSSWWEFKCANCGAVMTFDFESARLKLKTTLADEPKLDCS